MKTIQIKKIGFSAMILMIAISMLSLSTLETKNTENAAVAAIDGTILINGKSNIEVELEAGNVVSLFKDFKTGKHQVTFTFEGNDLPKDEQGRGVALIEFTTTLYEGKKKLGSVTRKPMPFFPGEMLEPVETFDIINLLTYAQGDPLKKAYPGKLDGKGNYRIVIAAKPVGAKGAVKQATMIVWI